MSPAAASRFADDGVPYAFAAHPFAAPVMLSVLAERAGYRAPDVRKPFRYLEPGCGNGVSLIALAALYPQASFEGIDFLPGAAAFARQLIADVGLTNVRIREGSFAEAAGDVEGAPCDFIVLHHVWSWVSAADRAALLQIIARRSAPGSLLYVSYHCQPGWRGLQPAADPAMARLNREMYVPYAAEVARELAGVGQAFLTSAEPLCNADALNFSAEVCERLRTGSDPELLRDRLLHRRFRQDLFGRGVRRLCPRGVSEVQDAQMFVLRREGGVPEALRGLQGVPVSLRAVLALLAHPDDLYALLQAGVLMPVVRSCDGGRAAAAFNAAVQKRERAGDRRIRARCDPDFGTAMLDERADA